mgnify:CR=1 FL=1
MTAQLGNWFLRSPIGGSNFGTLVITYAGPTVVTAASGEIWYIDGTAQFPGGPGDTSRLRRTPPDKAHPVSRLRRLLSGTAATDDGGGDFVGLRRLLYGLYAVLRLHNAQEDEGAVALVPVHGVSP